MELHCGNPHASGLAVCPGNQVSGEPGRTIQSFKDLRGALALTLGRCVGTTSFLDASLRPKISPPGPPPTVQLQQEREVFPDSCRGHRQANLSVWGPLPRQPHAFSPTFHSPAGGPRFWPPGEPSATAHTARPHLPLPGNLHAALPPPPTSSEWRSWDPQQWRSRKLAPGLPHAGLGAGAGLWAVRKGLDFRLPASGLANLMLSEVYCGTKEGKTTKGHLKLCLAH
ncbi:hypothetical protein H1C71_003184 [Ictidomys tridecemlineatus]|nr:hypothetical protein H1C71_003184 [Ictidomys tridecemlineatus]